MIQIREVDGREHVDLLTHFNSMDDCFPLLEDRHIDNGFWFVAYAQEHLVSDNVPSRAVGFAGMVWCEPFPLVGYLKRCYVLPEYRGRGLQSRFLKIREDKARKLGWTTLVSECAETNHASANNFKRGGYEICDPEQKWGVKSVYFVKRL
jgi:GNAT superfamily N-acetyltransferase